MLKITTERKYREDVRREAQAQAGHVLDRYSENHKLLEKAWLAFNGFGPDSGKRLTVRQRELMLRDMSRGIKEFAKGLAEERAGL